MERVTTRRVHDVGVDSRELATAVGVIREEGLKPWQPTQIVEELRETDEPEKYYWAKDGAAWQYTVKVTGLILRKDGSVGQMKAEALYSAPELLWRAAGGIEHIPADIAALLMGADRLSLWQRPGPRLLSAT